MLKKLIKNNIEKVAAKYGKHQRSGDGNHLVILGYHRVLPEDHPEFEIIQPGMRLTPNTLAMHIDTLREYFELVDLESWIKAIKTGQAVPKQACALTFDDGWVDNYEYAFPVLKEKNAPATIFLVSSMLDTKRKFWPERLTEVLLQLKNKQMTELTLAQKQWLEKNHLAMDKLSVMQPQQIDSIISDFKYLSDQQIYHDLEAFADYPSGTTGFAEQHILSSSQVKEMLDSGLVNFASHTRNHYRLNKIDDIEQLSREIEGSKDDLQTILGKEIAGFCYPNGDLDDAAIELVRANYEYACTTRKGWNDSQQDFLLLNRIMIHEDISNTPTALQAKISGWL